MYIGATGATGADGKDGATGATGADGALLPNPYGLFVKAGSTDGDGTQAKPFGTIDEAYSVVEPDGKITVLSGEYPVNSQLTMNKQRVTLEARQGATVMLTAQVVPFVITGQNTAIKGFAFTSDVITFSYQKDNSVSDNGDEIVIGNIGIFAE